MLKELTFQQKGIPPNTSVPETYNSHAGISEPSNNAAHNARLVFVGKATEGGGARLSGRSTPAQNRPFSGIPQNSVTRTRAPDKYDPAQC